MSDFNSSFFRNAGWSQLSGQWGDALLFTVVYVVILSTASTVLSYFALSLFASFFIGQMYYSYAVAFLQNKRCGKKLSIGSIFSGYSDFLRIGLTLLLKDLYVFLWSLLFLIPGVIKSISYSQTSFIMHDNPELGYNAAIERSMAMMDGYKMRYFWLQLSFIGWYIGVLLTCGLLMLWVNPYVAAANAHFYEYVKAEYEKKVS